MATLGTQVGDPSLRATPEVDPGDKKPPPRPLPPRPCRPPNEESPAPRSTAASGSAPTWYNDATKTAQVKRLQEEGFFCSLHRWSDLNDASAKPAAPFTDEEVEVRQRVLRNTYFDGSHILCVTLDEQMLDWRLRDNPLVQWLWEEKKVMVCMRFSVELSPLKDGVRTMKMDAAKLNDGLLKATSRFLFGVKSTAYILGLRPTGIAAAVRQQLDVARAAAARGLASLLHFEVGASPYDQSLCEHQLLLELLDGLDTLPREVSVFIVLTAPTKANTYFPLTVHPNVHRVLMCSGRHSREDVCRWLGQNYRMGADLGRAFFNDLLIKKLTNNEFETKFSKIRKEIFGSLNKQPGNIGEVQKLKLASHAGFLVDVSHNSGPGADSMTAPAKEVERVIQKLLTSPMFNGTRILAAILPPGALQFKVSGGPVASHLWDKKGVAAVLQVQSLKDSENSEELLEQAAELGFTGVELGSIIEKVSRESDIRQVVDEMFSLGRRVSATQLLPFCRLEVRGTASQKAAIETQLLQVLLTSLGEFTCEEQVVLELVEPSQRNLYLPLTNHPSVVRLVLRPQPHHGAVARTDDALRLFEQNESIAAIMGQGFLEECGTAQGEEFNQKMGLVCKTLYRGATSRSAREEQRNQVVLQGGFFALLDSDCGNFGDGDGGRVKGTAAPPAEGGTPQLSKGASYSPFGNMLRRSKSGIWTTSNSAGGDTVAKPARGGSRGATPRLGEQQATEPSSGPSDSTMKALVGRLATHPDFEGTNVLGAVLSEAAMLQEVKGAPMPKYMWNRKRVVPFVALDGNGLNVEVGGVQLARGVTDTDVHLQAKLSKAAKAGIFGTKLRSCIRQADEGISALVQQQFNVAKLAVAQGLVPIVHIEVAADSNSSHYCECMLFDELTQALDDLNVKEQILLMLSPPTAGNQKIYLPLQGHPNVLRLVIQAPAGDRGEACTKLASTLSLLSPVAAFDVDLLEGLTLEQSDQEFADAVRSRCRTLRGVCTASAPKEEQLVKMEGQPGFIVCFAQDATVTSTLLRSYTLGHVSEEMKKAELNLRAHEMRSRIISGPIFNGMRVLGAILTEPALAFTFDHLPCARFLWERKRVVPFLRVDQGLNKEKDGVQTFKEEKNLERLLERAVAAGIFGIITRSTISRPKAKGVQAIVAQQIEMAKRILLKNLVPVIQIEVAISATSKEACEKLLLSELLAGLDKLPPTSRLIVDVGLPEIANTYLPIAQHPKVIRLGASSSGHTRDEAIRRLQENSRMIASFGRAFQEGLNINQTDKEFSEALTASCKNIYVASMSRGGKRSPRVSGTSTQNDRTSRLSKRVVGSTATLDAAQGA